VNQPQVKAWLIGLLPEGFTDWWDFSPGADADKILETAADGFKNHLLDDVDAVQQDVDLLRLTSVGIAAWEGALGLEPLGTNAKRLSAITSKLRECGASTEPNIKASFTALLGSEPTLIRHTRAVMNELNWRDFSGLPVAIAASADSELNVVLRDNAPVGRAGARVTLRVTHPSIEDLTLKLYAPDGSSSEVFSFGAGSVTTQDFVFRWLGAAGKDISGTWRVVITDSGSSGGSVDDPAGDTVSGLLVEGIGRAASGADGYGGRCFEWSVVYNPVTMASKATAAEAQALARRWSQAHTDGGVAVIQSDTVLAALSDDTYCIADQCVAG